MSITCTLRRVNETDLRRLREAPEQAFTFIYGEPVPLEEVREPGLVGFLLRSLGVRTEKVREASNSDESTKQHIQNNDDELSLDKAWHGLHYLFTGTDEGGQEPECFLLCGGEEIGDEDVGPARVLRPAQVSQFAAFLAGLSDDEIVRRYDPTRMTALRIYPEPIWTQSAAPGESGFDYLFGAFEDLKDFVTATATRGESLIISII